MFNDSYSTYLQGTYYKNDNNDHWCKSCDILGCTSCKDYGFPLVVYCMECDTMQYNLQYYG